jgi:protein SCO1/2
MTRPRAVVLTALLLTLSAGGTQAAINDPADYAWRTAPGATIPLGFALRDEAGHQVHLGDFFGTRPVILDLGYYHCPSLCGVVRADLLNALQTSGLRGGHDYQVVALSIDPAETPRDAGEARQADLAQATFATPADWHYLTGDHTAIAAVESAIGFRAEYDAQLREFLHPAGLVVLTPAGVISGYVLGVGYTGGDLRAAVTRAGAGGIAKAVLPVLLLCFHFDSTTGRYTLAIVKVLRLMGAITVLSIAALLLVLHRHRARAKS